ncbi:glycine cleavage system H protein [Dinoroseobacter shibae DFL 12 = DSM 16493]|jgi:glycine cleavage system H protein|uniref:Glycine cleavage system H protein n=1 Tax=Dinoroseobacter shibae (strain DSM 16493 / NCIMB 14021 / DFL 12) TaxID=398580 RepID=GCSH_DINSH|nr:glycine cleavage system protein GcvH [Dinoroseobacter shibae]A8LIH3.1 RecName: Full=Glycine cleavage system H protein [Dinoroseobacter shibae DFL 12 = DSM 16493]ABV94414.1 glycine cleavage system H protein [Dinoroseobacter shibae DFL 12 = DSM 16493]URF45841.1 glycine cleavage system protein GcvH [Dinoroseobacter shibae]URF50148.1 glycine cleavage system protein GcvH [Dinoroseobacter shibae]
MPTTYYTDDHEWIEVEDDTATIGITKHAAEQLGEVVFIELQPEGETFVKGDEIGVVESVKAASDIFAPVTGEILEANAALVETPAELNEDPEGNSWLYKIKLSDPGELSELLDAEGYAALIG